jgi:hypothetical protein
MTKVQVMLPDGKWYLAEDLEAVQMSLGEHHFSELWIRFLDPNTGAQVQAPMSSVVAVRTASDKEVAQAEAAMTMLENILGGKK